MHGYILTCSELTRDNVWELWVLNAGHLNFCVRSTPLRLGQSRDRGDRPVRHRRPRPPFTEQALRGQYRSSGHLSSSENSVISQAKKRSWPVLGGRGRFPLMYMAHADINFVCRDTYVVVLRQPNCYIKDALASRAAPPFYFILFSFFFFIEERRHRKYICSALWIRLSH